MSKQTTLFESWSSKSSQKRKQNDSKTARHDTRENANVVDEDDDALLVMAMEQSLQQYNAQTASNQMPSASSRQPPRTWTRNSGDTGKTCLRSAEDQNENYEDLNPDDFTSEIEEGDVENRNPRNVEHLPGFDVEAGNMWIYPTNYPVREYQFNIVMEALYQNTLVVLPTGLGKTFIAAVIMYNFYRWYPRGKVVFMAPTKPLVAQQIEACYNIMGIPQCDTAEMTGNSPDFVCKN